MRLGHEDNTNYRMHSLGLCPADPLIECFSYVLIVAVPTSYHQRACSHGAASGSACDHTAGLSSAFLLLLLEVISLQLNNLSDQPSIARLLEPVL